MPQMTGMSQGETKTGKRGTTGPKKSLFFLFLLLTGKVQCWVAHLCEAVNNPVSLWWERKERMEGGMEHPSDWISRAGYMTSLGC